MAHVQAPWKNSLLAKRESLASEASRCTNEFQAAEQAFLRSCQFETVTPMQMQSEMMKLTEHLDRRLKELFANFKDSAQSSHRKSSEQIERLVSPETLQKLSKSCEETTQEVQQLAIRLKGLEEAVLGQLAATKSFAQGRSRTGSDNELALNYERTVALESRLEFMEGAQAKRHEELKTHINNLSVGVTQAAERLREQFEGPLTSFSNSVLVNDVLAKTTASKTVSPAESAPTPASWERSSNVDGLKELLGWSMPEESKDVVGDDSVKKCHTYVTQLSTMLILVNAIFIGVCLHVNMNALKHDPRSDLPTWQKVGDACFLVAFIIELALRASLEKKLFFRGPEAGWNAADLVTTAAFAVEVASNGMIGNASFVRSLRFLRFLRVGRMFRLVRKLRTMRLLLISLYNIVWPLLCVLGFELIVLYLAAIGITQAVEHHIISNRIPQTSGQDDMYELYGSPWATMLSLFMVVSGGAEWRDMLRPLNEVSPVLVPAFVIVAAFSIFGTANLLSAIIVDTVIHDSQTGDRLAMREAMAEKASAIQELRDLLKEGKSESIGIGEARKKLRTLGQHHLKGMDVQLETANGLLKMLDTEKSGHINIEEFLCGLSQLQVDNMSVQMATTMYESKKILLRIHELQRTIETFQLFVAASSGTVNHRASHQKSDFRPRRSISWEF